METGNRVCTQTRQRRTEKAVLVQGRSFGKSYHDQLKKISYVIKTADHLVKSGVKSPKGVLVDADMFASLNMALVSLRGEKG